MQAPRACGSAADPGRRRPTTRRRPAAPPPSAAAPASTTGAPPAARAPNARLAEAADAAALPQDKYDRLLRWACGFDDDAADAAASSPPRAPPRVRVVDASAAGGGRGLVAREAVEEGGVLMAVPLSRVFCSEPKGEGDDGEDDGDEDTPWAVGMGARLLELVRAADDEQRRRQRPPQQPPLGGWALWASALPQRIVTPLDFSERAIEACGEGGTARGVGAAIAGMQAALRRTEEARRRRKSRGGAGNAAAAADDGGGGGEDDDRAALRWAAKVLSSRCFFEPSLGAHLCVPGVDMANHGGAEASARVELARSPQAVQGAHVGDEYFPPASAGGAANESEFRLVADRDLAEGEAVTISYGRWPAEVFFLLFGFVPAAGAGADAGGAPLPLPGDALLLYEDADELADHVARVLEAAHQGDAAAARLWRAAPQGLAPDAAASASRLAATPEGLDARLSGALAALAERAAAEGAAAEGAAPPPPPPAPGALVRARAAELLERYERAAARGEAGEEMALARAYASAKAATCRAVLAALGGAGPR
jgi:hypothetical protein